MQKLSPETRTRLVLHMADTMLQFLDIVFLAPSDDGMDIMGQNLLKGLLAGGAAAGFFRKNPKMAQIYTNKSLKPSQKAIAIATEFARDMMAEPDFHTNSGEWVDAKLLELYELFSSEEVSSESFGGANSNSS